jgi:hypothetical protein
MRPVPTLELTFSIHYRAPTWNRTCDLKLTTGNEIYTEKAENDDHGPEALSFSAEKTTVLNWRPCRADQRQGDNATSDRSTFKIVNDRRYSPNCRRIIEVGFALTRHSLRAL